MAVDDNDVIITENGDMLFEDNVKIEYDMIIEDDIKVEDDVKVEDNVKIEDDIKVEDDDIKVEDDVKIDDVMIIEDDDIKVEDDVILIDDNPLRVEGAHLGKVECSIDFYCQFCNVEYNNVSALMNHLIFTHPDSPELIQIRSALSEVLSKPDKYTVKKMSPKLHCKLCNFECDYLKSLIKHIALTHSGSVESDKIRKYFRGYNKTCQLSGVPMANLNSTDFMEMKNFCNNLFRNGRKRLKEMPICNSDSKSKELIRCQECRYSYKGLYALWRHCRCRHTAKTSSYHDFVKNYSNNVSDDIVKISNKRYKFFNKYGIQCYECTKLFTSPTYLHNHYKDTHTELTFSVIDLNKIYYSININYSSAFKALPIKINCNKCYESFFKPSYLCYHYNTLHGQHRKYNDVFLQFYSYDLQKIEDIIVEIPETVGKQNKIVQDISAVITSSIIHADNEKLIDALRKQMTFGIICNICMQCCNTSSELLKHHKGIHSTTKLELALECYECKKDFEAAVALWNHYKLIHTKMVFTLSNLEIVCSIPYKKNNEVEKNVENENSAKIHILRRLVVHVPCYECDIHFNTPSTLWSHYCDAHVDKTYNFDDVFIQFYRIDHFMSIL